jgi:ABC-type multidrug transport system ATPase subunit
MTNSALEVNNVSKTYASVKAVEDLSFTVEPGEIFGLLGPNGAGKTTSIRMILDIIKPDQGQITVLGGPMSEATKARIGYLPEERGLYNDMTLQDTLLFSGPAQGSGPPDRPGAGRNLPAGSGVVGSQRPQDRSPEPGYEPEGPVYGRHLARTGSDHH